jgi:hypothetical protein
MPKSLQILVNHCRWRLKRYAEYDVRKLAKNTEGELAQLKNCLESTLTKPSPLVEDSMDLDDFTLFIQAVRDLGGGSEEANNFLAQIFSSMALYRISENNFVRAYEYGFLAVSFFIASYFDSPEMDNVFKLVELGEKQKKGLAEGRIESAKKRKNKSYHNKKEWIDMAIDQWKITPGWTNNEMAESIKEKLMSECENQCREFGFEVGSQQYLC